MYAQTNMIKKIMLIKKSIFIAVIALLGLFLIKGNKNHIFAEKEILAIGIIAHQEKTAHLDVAEKIAQQLNKTVLIKNFENLNGMLKSVETKEVAMVFSHLDTIELGKQLKKFPETMHISPDIVIKKGNTLLQATIEKVLQET